MDHLAGTEHPNSDARDSNYFFWNGETTIFPYEYPENAWKNGSAISNWDLSPITNWMILRAVVNDDNTGPHSSYQIGRVTAFQCNLDIAEIIAFDSIISDTDAAFVEGYMAVKWGLISELPNSHDYKNYSAWPDVFLTTGQPVSVQIGADRNPTTWTATGLANGLSIDNNGIISGTTNYIGSFNATVTASNEDGNHSNQFHLPSRKETNNYLGPELHWDDLWRCTSLSDWYCHWIG